MAPSHASRGRAAIATACGLHSSGRLTLRAAYRDRGTRGTLAPRMSTMQMRDLWVLAVLGAAACGGVLGAADARRRPTARRRRRRAMAVAVAVAAIRTAAIP